MSNVESVITTTVLISSTSRSNFVRSDPILDKSILSAMSLFWYTESKQAFSLGQNHDPYAL